MACQTCRDRKTRCDTGDPCITCHNLQVPCFRITSSAQNTQGNDVLELNSDYLITNTVATQTIKHASSGNDMIFAMSSPKDQCTILGFDPQSPQSPLHSDWKERETMIYGVPPLNVAEGMDFDENASRRVWGRCADNIIFR